MKKLKSLIILLLLLIASTSFGLDTNSIKYMPLHVGDFWVYNFHATSHGGSFDAIYKYSVLNSRVYNNHLYFYMYSSYNGFYIGYVRVDSTTGSLYAYDSTNSCSYYYYEKLLDSLAANNGDSIKNCAGGAYRCTGTVPTTIFNDSTSRISFYQYYSTIGGSSSSTVRYTKKYGYTYSGSYFSSGTLNSSSYISLKGCKINGIVYGDTISTSINIISTETPSKYSLSQNYPNPFNPTTKIKFDIAPSLSFPNVSIGNPVQLKVYDILGREVRTLVNESLKPGTYEATFDGSSLNTGVYFYKLITNTFSETKKMLLIK